MFAVTAPPDVGVGNNQCEVAVALTEDGTTVIITKGNSSDTWGNALTSDWVKNSNFGVALGINATAANADVDIDYVTLEINYTAAIDGVACPTTVRSNGTVGSGSTAAVNMLSVGALNKFQVNDTGHLSRVNNVSYSWPTSQASGQLTNNGAGVLSWAPAGGSGPAGGWVDGGTSVYLNNTTANVGIGITLPGAKVRVLGAGTWTGFALRGAGWIPADVIGDFIKHLLKAGKYHVTYIPALATWEIESQNMAYIAQSPERKMGNIQNEHPDPARCGLELA